MIDKEEINGEIDVGETIRRNLDYWKNKCFELENRIKELEKERDYYLKQYSETNDMFK